MEGCVFCRIVVGETPANFVYQDDSVVAFMDVQPVNRGHTLVIARVHVEGIADLEPSLGGHLFTVATKLSDAVRRAAGSDGINLFVADGEAAGQDVFHFHLHIIPRLRGDGVGFRFPPGYPSSPSRETLDETAESIRRFLVSG